MKKIVSLLMVLAIMLTATTAFAFETSVTEGLQVNAVEDENGIVAVTVTANTTKNVQGITLYLKLNGVAPVSAADNSVEVTSTNPVDACAVNAGVAAKGYAVSQAKYTAGSYYKVVLGGTTAIACANQELCTIYFKNTAATLADDAFAFATNTAGNSKISYGDATQVQTKTPADQKYFGLSITKYEAPIIEEDKFINDEGANGGVGTITFYGRVGADWLDQDYGVIVEGKDFFGAKNGDIVADGEGTKTFEFDAWDGNFEIIMTNITEKGTAGTKTYQFFVGENLTEEATVVVE